MHNFVGISGSNELQTIFRGHLRCLLEKPQTSLIQNALVLPLPHPLWPCLAPLHFPLGCGETRLPAAQRLPSCRPLQEDTRSQKGGLLLPAHFCSPCLQPLVLHRLTLGHSPPFLGHISSGIGWLNDPFWGSLSSAFGSGAQLRSGQQWWVQCQM